MHSPIFFTAGPSQLFSMYAEFYQQALELHLGSANHRSDVFRSVYKNTDEQLRQLLNITPQHEIYFLGSASEIWERMISNLVYQHSFHFVNGSFSQKFYDYSKALGKNASGVFANHGEGFEVIKDIENYTDLICTTQNETSSGVFLPSAYLKNIKINNPHALLCTDLVSIAPLSSLDYNYIDASFFSVQKAFGMPPGLGVWIVNDKCLQQCKELISKKINIGAHHTLPQFHNNYINWETPSTPNIIAIYVLGKIAEQFNNVGISTVQKIISQKANLVYSFASISNQFSVLVTVPEFRSESVIILKCKTDSAIIIKYLKDNYNLHVTSGYGKYKSSEIRIANFPTTTLAQMQYLVDALQQFEKL
jgi:phosphoserine aminotransferase